MEITITLSEEQLEVLRRDIVARVKADLQEGYLTAEQAGEYIGANRQRIADLTWKGKIPVAGRDGAKPLYLRSDLDRYLQARR